MDEDAPTIERIHTLTHDRREGRKNISAHLRKSSCYKAAFSRKQGLTQMNKLLKLGAATYLRIYKCRICSCWHLTHQLPRA